MPRILHFADAHIDIAAQGRHDPATGLAVRAMDFLKALDTIVDTAIQEKVDLVLFAGDAYKDRTPVPTFQREWGRRMVRLSQAGIPTLLLVGNHDLSPAAGRAHALQEYETLAVPFVHAVSKPTLLGPQDLDGVPLQVFCLPWLNRSGAMAAMELSGDDAAKIYQKIEATLTELVEKNLETADPDLPLVFAAHASVAGAKYGGERSVMLGADLVLPGSMVRDLRIDYTALGHIHKPQDVNEGLHPPVVYPGSIERVDFGEAAEERYFVIADVQKGKTAVDWRKLNGRRFIDRSVKIVPGEDATQQALNALPPAEELAGAVVRLVVDYPYELEAQLDEGAIRRVAEKALEFHYVRRPRRDTRLRLPEDTAVASLTPLELLEKYWKAADAAGNDIEELQKLAAEVFGREG